MNDDHARQLLQRAADDIEAPAGLAAAALTAARRQRARQVSLAAGVALAVAAAGTTGLILRDEAGQERLASEPAASPAFQRDYLRVLLPTEAPNSEVPLPVDGLDTCLGMPGAGRLDSQITESVLTVTAEGDQAQRQAVQDCLRELDRVRVLRMSGPEHVPVDRAGGLTPEQAARSGTDGTARTAQAQYPAQDSAAPKVTAGYLSDAAGFEQWEWEYSGGLRISPFEPPYGDGLIALCWLTGNIPSDPSVNGAPGGYASQLVAVQLTGQTGVRLDKRSPTPLAVLAPPQPADTHLPADAGQQVVHPQPASVTVTDELAEPPVEPSAPQQDCVPYGCPLDGEVEVRVEVAVDGRPLRPGDTATVPGGEPVQLDVLVRVEEGEQITDLLVGMSSGGLGAGPDGPTGIEQTLVNENSLTGERRYELELTVPDDGKLRQLVIGYLHTPRERSEGGQHARTVGGLDPQ